MRKEWMKGMKDSRKQGLNKNGCALLAMAPPPMAVFLDPLTTAALVIGMSRSPSGQKGGHRYLPSTSGLISGTAHLRRQSQKDGEIGECDHEMENRRITFRSLVRAHIRPIMLINACSGRLGVTLFNPGGGNIFTIKTAEDVVFLQKILAHIGSFCLVINGIFVLGEIFVLYAGSTAVVSTTSSSFSLVVSWTLSLARHVQEHYHLDHCGSRTGRWPSPLFRQIGTLTNNKFTSNSATILTYGPFSAIAIDSWAVVTTLLVPVMATKSKNREKTKKPAQFEVAKVRRGEDNYFTIQYTDRADEALKITLDLAIHHLNRQKSMPLGSEDSFEGEDRDNTLEDYIDAVVDVDDFKTLLPSDNESNTQDGDQSLQDMVLSSASMLKGAQHYDGLDDVIANMEGLRIKSENIDISVSTVEG
ncbi:hypothetical protein CVT24_005879 [Panaeolus cyanescens]|uniref:Uncharacterized protein n=1 Tax=Panaeolus cyanescens TaxID=181874 RepID=A0A409WZJ1_9AGAR|nr:hypothetical protein CVT24_005879 [Panaeolus cyanescens]